MARASSTDAKAVYDFVVKTGVGASFLVDDEICLHYLAVAIGWFLLAFRTTIGVEYMFIRSGPIVRFITLENVVAELKASTRDFFSHGGNEVDLAKRTVHLTSIIKWFSADFGNDKEILKWVINYLESSNAGLMTHLLGDWGNLNIMYQNYDWSLNL